MERPARALPRTAAWGTQITAKGLSGLTGMLGDMMGSAFADLGFKPWTDTAAQGDWLRAAGCK